MDHIKAANLARQLMNQHGLTQTPFEWRRGKRQAGSCHWRYRAIDNKYYCSSISLSIYFVQMNDEAEIRNTILHEIAHVLAGYGHRHDYHWVRIARSIGSAGERCYGDEVKMPKGRYKATCCCGKDFFKHRLGSNMRNGRLRCRKCKGVLRFVDTHAPVYA